MQTYAELLQINPIEINEFRLENFAQNCIAEEGFIWLKNWQQWFIGNHPL